MNTETHLRYWLELGGFVYHAREVIGDEAMSTPFRIEVRFAAEGGAAPSPQALVNAEAHLHLARALNGAAPGLPGHVRTITGIATSIRVFAAPGGAPEVRVVIEPRLVLARYRSDVRIFRDKTVPQIVTEVLAQIGVTPELRLQDSYPARAYCVQYRESDLDFVRRLLEDEGIFFYFSDDAMILGDHPAAYEPISGSAFVPFREASGLDDDRDAVSQIGWASRMTPGRFSLRDFCTDHPSLDMDVAAEGPCPAGPEFYDYPGEYAVPADGSRKARLMAEAAACEARSIRGRSFCGRLAPGHTFGLEDAPEGAPEGRLAVTSIHHEFHRTQAGFDNAFTALDARAAFRPQRVTPVPVITNPQTAFVTGPPGDDDIHTDAFARVKVHFHWDRRQPLDDHCSDWVPVLQENTGSSCSMPRVGWEVLVHFLEGDPDRPVVLGRLWNAGDVLPFKLPNDKTWSQLRSHSSPRNASIDDTGHNFITLRDTAGLEEVAFRSEKNQRVLVANDKLTTVLNGEQISVNRDEKLAVGSNQDVVTGDNLDLRVTGNQSVTVAGNRKLTAGLDVNASVKGDRSLTIGGMHQRRTNTSDTAGGDTLVERVGGVILEASVGSNSARATKTARITVGGAIVEIAGGNKTTSSAWGRVETVGGLVLTKAEGAIQLRADKRRLTTVGGVFKVSAAKSLMLGAKKKVGMTTPTATMTGTKEITLKVGETEIVMKDGVLKVKCSKEITVTITGKAELGAGDSIQI